MSFTPDFTPVRAAMQRYVDQNLLAGVSHAVLHGRELIEQHCTGFADVEARTPLREDHLFRIFSNTKLVTSMAVLLLVEAGHIGLDDPVANWIPQLANRQVLRPGATAIDDTEPARSDITVRQLLTHSSGLSYGLLDPGTLMFKAYVNSRTRDPRVPLSVQMDRLQPLPLAFHPGTGWEYSVATDVLGHLIEVISGQGLDTFFAERIFGPLGMVDTGFWVPPDQFHRLTAYYTGADLQDPLKPGLTRIDHAPYPGAYTQRVPGLSGGGGLVSSLPDMLALMRSLLPGGPTLLKPETRALMMRNHLQPGQHIGFQQSGVVVGKGFGLGGAVTLAPSSLDPAASTDEFQWGGIAGTHWWISPRTGLSGLLMTQRAMGFWHPFAFEFKQRVYAAVSR